MKIINEVWSKGNLINIEEKDDGISDLFDINERLKIIELKLKDVK